MNKESPEINPQEITEVSTLAEREHEIILYNDEVNTFDHVIECLINIC
ncbi:ATP-dependent Clp protease adaptor ClpS, partial [Flavobacteriaceae bacterium]|nr:ATP-dependent Clp protease adaptor ClpS [Flavobacteriaceae bacterium]